MELMHWIQTIGAIFGLYCLMTILMTLKKQLRAFVAQHPSEGRSIV